MATVGEAATIKVEKRTIEDINKAWTDIHTAILELAPYFGEAAAATHAAMDSITETLKAIEKNKQDSLRLQKDRSQFAKRGRA